MKQHNHINEAQQSKIIESSAFLSIFPHLFCCGIPLALSILSSFGIYLPMPSFIEKIEQKNLEIYIFLFSGALLALSFYIYLHGKQNHCQKECCHDHKSEKTSKIVLSLALSIYLANLIYHIL